MNKVFCRNIISHKFYKTQYTFQVYFFLENLVFYDLSKAIMSFDENITLSNLYHPDLAQIYSFYQYSILFCSSVLSSFAIYVILKKSSSHMGIYKKLLIYQVFWSLSLDLMLTLWQPINLVPFFMFYPMGITKVFGPYGIYSMLCLCFGMYGGLVHSIMVSLLYRISRVYRMHVLEHGRTWVKITVGMLIFVEILIASKY